MKRDSKVKQDNWVKPIIEWEEAYEPTVFAASCTSEPFNCGGGAHG